MWVRGHASESIPIRFAAILQGTSFARRVVIPRIASVTRSAVRSRLAAHPGPRAERAGRNPCKEN